MLRAEHPSLREIQHRPWPLPRGSWCLKQSWRRLLFAHWPVEPPILQALLPAGLQIECYDGLAWLGVVPFELTIRHRFGPPVPTACRFPEINVRTYVTDGRRSGVWFFSLDACSRLAVWGARRFFSLPYFYARMQMLTYGDQVDYRSCRQASRVEFRGTYGPSDAPSLAAAGSLAHFLVERYCLYSAGPDGALYRADVHHAPWPLCPAWAKLENNTMADPLAVDLVGDPLLHYAEGLPVVSWPLQRVSAVDSPALVVHPL